MSNKTCLCRNTDYW